MASRQLSTPWHRGWPRQQQARFARRLRRLDLDAHEAPAARLLADLGAPARAALEEAWHSDDAVVRQTALKALVQLDGVDQRTVFAQALADGDLTVRLLAAGVLAARPRTDETTALLQTAGKDAHDAVRAVADTLGEREAAAMVEEAPRALLEGREPEAPGPGREEPRRRGWLARLFRGSGGV